uniref:Fibronectin type-III domain-containing protein n=1 Tax=Sphaeramia orbicularis TaxID=375764 RepID=A0A673AB94_9TELE
MTKTRQINGKSYGFLIRVKKTPVVWHLNHSSALPWHQVTSNGSLVLLQVDHSVQGDYSCYDNQGLLVHSIKLKLGYPPGLLSISCQVPNHTHVRCSWVESVKTFLPAAYNASFRDGREWRPCIVDTTHRHCDIDHPAFWQTTHVLRITETNVLGSQTTLVLLTLHELLKPNPPEAVSVSPLEGYPKKLQVSWDFPSSWPQHDAFPLMFHVRYRPLGSIYWSEIFSEDTSVMIFDALAGHVHQIQVRARDEVNSESQWSEWSNLVFAHPWEVIPVIIFPARTNPETSTAKSHNPAFEEEGNLGLVILLVLFSVVILTTVLSLIFVVW